MLCLGVLFGRPRDSRSDNDGYLGSPLCSPSYEQLPGWVGFVKIKNKKRTLSAPNFAQNISQCKLQPIQQRVSSGTCPSVRYISHHVYRKENHGTASGLANSHKHVQHQPGMSQDTRPSTPFSFPTIQPPRPAANSQPTLYRYRGTEYTPSSCPISHTPTADPDPSPWYTSSTRSPRPRRPGSSPAPARSPSAGAPPRGPWP